MAIDSSKRTPPPVPTEVAALGKPTLWSAEILRRELTKEAATARQLALAMCLMPGAPINECVSELHQCTELALANPENALLTQLSAVALGNLLPQSASEITDALLARLASLLDEATQTHAAYALFRLQRMPLVAQNPIALLLFSPSENLRKVANLSLTPFAKNAAAAIVEVVSTQSPSAWNAEALDALAKSCGADATRQKTVQDFLLRGVKGQPLVPTGIAVFAAMARISPEGPGVDSLVKTALQDDEQAALAALSALAQLGAHAKSAAPALAKALATLDKPAREESICRILVSMQVAASALPKKEIMARISTGPDRASAAHCMLAALHAESFASTALAMKARYSTASLGLRTVLSATYTALTGLSIESPANAGG